MITTKLSWDPHLKDKHILAKLLVNSLWRNIFIDNRLPLSIKYSGFTMIIIVTVCYGCLVWGYRESNHLEGT